jgi:hypothetical protein
MATHAQSKMPLTCNFAGDEDVADILLCSRSRSAGIQSSIMAGFQAMADILATVITSGGTVLAAVVAGAAGYLGARRGTRVGLESSRVERMWENRVTVYKDLAAWVRERREVNDRRCPPCLRGETVQLEPREDYVGGFPQAGQLEIWGSPEVRDLCYEFAWWDDWVYLEILALQDPTGEGRFIKASRKDLGEIYKDVFETGNRLIERIRAELSGDVRSSSAGTPKSD